MRPQTSSTPAGCMAACRAVLSRGAGSEVLGEPRPANRPPAWGAGGGFLLFISTSSSYKLNRFLCKSFQTAVICRGGKR